MPQRSSPSDSVRQEGNENTVERFLKIRKIEICDIDWSHRFWKTIPEIKIVVHDEDGRVRIFRSANGGRFGSCTLCVFRAECQTRGFVESLGGNIRVLECPYFFSDGHMGDCSGDLPPAQKATLLSFSQLVVKAYNSNPVALKMFLDK